MDDPYLCECGAKMIKRSCRLDREAALLVRYLTCPACGGKRQLLVRPEEILDVLYLQRNSKPLCKTARTNPPRRGKKQRAPKSA